MKQKFRYDFRTFQLMSKLSVYHLLSCIFLFGGSLVSCAQQNTHSSETFSTHISEKEKFRKLNDSLYFNYLDENKKTLQQRIADTEYIFEGVVVDVQYFHDSLENNTARAFSAMTINVCKIFRGEGKINYGTIQVILEGGYIYAGNEITHEYGDPPSKLFIGERGVYFCTKSPYPSSPYSSDNEIQLKGTYEIGVAFSDRSSGTPPKWSVFGFRRNFKNQDSVYAFMKNYDNIAIPNEDNCPFDFKRHESPPPPSTSKIATEMSAEKFQEWMDFWNSMHEKNEKKKNNNQKQN